MEEFESSLRETENILNEMNAQISSQKTTKSNTSENKSKIQTPQLNRKSIIKLMAEKYNNGGKKKNEALVKSNPKIALQKQVMKVLRDDSELSFTSALKSMKTPQENNSSKEIEKEDKKVPSGETLRNISNISETVKPLEKKKEKALSLFEKISKVKQSITLPVIEENEEENDDQDPNQDNEEKIEDNENIDSEPVLWTAPKDDTENSDTKTTDQSSDQTAPTTLNLQIDGTESQLPSPSDLSLESPSLPKMEDFTIPISLSSRPLKTFSKKTQNETLVSEDAMHPEDAIGMFGNDNTQSTPSQPTQTINDVEQVVPPHINLHLETSQSQYPLSISSISTSADDFIVEELGLDTPEKKVDENPKKKLQKISVKELQQEKKRKEREIKEQERAKRMKLKEEEAKNTVKVVDVELQKELDDLLPDSHRFLQTEATPCEETNENENEKEMEAIEEEAEEYEEMEENEEEEEGEDFYDDEEETKAAEMSQIMRLRWEQSQSQMFDDGSNSNPLVDEASNHDEEMSRTTSEIIVNSQTINDSNSQNTLSQKTTSTILKRKFSFMKWEAGSDSLKREKIELLKRQNSYCNTSCSNMVYGEDSNSHSNFKDTQKPRINVVAPSTDAHLLTALSRRPTKPSFRQNSS